MRFKEVLNRFRHERGCAEGLRQGGFEGSNAKLPLTIRENQDNRRLTHLLIETASLVPVLTIAIANPGPFSFSTRYEDGPHKVVTLGCGLLQNSADWITVMERRVIGARSTIDLVPA